MQFIKLAVLSTSACTKNYHRRGFVQGHVKSLGINRYSYCYYYCKTETYLHWKTNRKSCGHYQYGTTAMTSNELDGHLLFETFLTQYLKKCSMY